MAWFRRRNAGAAAVKAESRRFSWLAGRRHVATAPYVLPTDDQEINRLDFQHYMLRFVLRGNYAAPLANPSSILDVGCGTCRWAAEMAHLFPSANVVGVDLVPPKLAEGDAMPSNFSFVEANVLDRLPFADATFDYVHVRLLLFAIPMEKWPALAREVVRVTKPGGWIESVETGPQQNGGPAMDQLVQWIIEASTRRGVNSLYGPNIAGVFEEAGVRNMRKRDISLPVGAYGGRVGTMAATDVFAVVEGVKQLVAAQGITPVERYDAALVAARADLDRVRCTLPFYIAWGQRGR